MAVTFLFLILVSFQITDSAYSPGANKFCLSCQNVQDPRACTDFVQVWQHEVCTTERIVLVNGTTVWNMGYEDGIACDDHEFIPVGRSRVRRASAVGMTVCHECCHTDLCNHKLCDSPSYNDLACLKGEAAVGQPSDTDVAYCNRNESCSVIQPSHSRPGQFHYGCSSQVMCNQIPANNPHVMCQRCCNTDGCNAHACSVVPVFADCWDLRTRGGFTQDGLYDIYPPPGNLRVRVRCDMQTDGGGWLVFHRRYDGSLSFANRTFNEYAEGFGALFGEFWLGLEYVYQMTSYSSPMKLRVDICDRRRPYYAEYDMFSIGSRDAGYRLHIDQYHGDAGNQLSVYNAARFTVAGVCAQKFGGWWYFGCRHARLNGENFTTGVIWGKPRSAGEMKIRPMFADGDSTPYVCPV